MSRWLSLSCLLLLVFAGCNDEDCPDCPGNAGDPLPTLANIWPHADGTGWIYDLEYRSFDGPEISPEPPPLPTMEELHDALQQPVGYDEVNLDEGLYRIRFEGTVTTESGVVGQDLVETFYSAVSGKVSTTSNARDFERRFLRALVRARADLRPAIAARLGEELDGAKSLEDVRYPFFLGAYAFAYEDTGYYGYGDLDTAHAWTYLEGDLTVGSGFTLQLVPDLANDIWLYGRVWSVGDREIAGVTWPNALEAMYVVDFGIQIVTNEMGEEIGSFHSYFYGTTVFAPAVGPIACLERHVLIGDGILQEPGTWTEEYRCIIAR